MFYVSVENVLFTYTLSLLLPSNYTTLWCDLTVLYYIPELNMIEPSIKVQLGVQGQLSVIINNKSAVARFARNIILVAQYRNLNRLKHNGF